MKRICKGLIVIFTVSWLTAPAYAADPCKSVFCLYGKAVGSSGGSECSSAETDFLKKLKRKREKFAGVKHLMPARHFLISVQRLILLLYRKS